MTSILWRSIPFALAVPVLLAACERSPREVSFSRDVQPVLQQHCASCHVPGQPGYEASGLSVAGYEALMKGTRYGPVVLPGDALTSALVMLIEGRADPSIRMPHGEEKLPDADIEAIHNWVEQGAKNN